MKNYTTPEIAIITLTPEGIVTERDTIALAKMAHSEKRRQDKKFKAKSLKKFLTIMDREAKAAIAQAKVMQNIFDIMFKAEPLTKPNNKKEEK